MAAEIANFWTGICVVGAFALLLAILFVVGWRILGKQLTRMGLAVFCLGAGIAPLKRILICCLGVCCTMPLYSANVVWDGITTWDATECIIGANLGGGRSLSLGLEKSAAGSCSYVYTANFFDMMFAGNWAQARLDDVVSDASFANSAEDMAYTKPYYDSFIVEVGSSASAMANESLYLIFKCGWMYETETVQDPIYGWVEYNVGEDGTLTYLHSAWDLDGGAMVVGGGSATPEPTSGVLLLFGVALLGLRRRLGLSCNSEDCARS